MTEYVAPLLIFNGSICDLTVPGKGTLYVDRLIAAIQFKHWKLLVTAKGSPWFTMGFRPCRNCCKKKKHCKMNLIT